MRAFAAVFAREVFARRIVFPVAFAAGFMPLIGSLAYGWSKPDAAEGRVLVALVAAATFSFAFALLFGGSVIAGETSEKRISFFFSRPISAAAIWSGKLVAVLFLTFVPAALALVPAFVTSTAKANVSVSRLGGAQLGVLALFLATLLVALGAHAVVTIARLRSPWVALDLLLAPALVLLAAAFLRSLLRDTLANEFSDAGGPKALTVTIVLLAGAVFVALLLASFVQVAEGRSDARRAHGAFSIVFFGILGTAVALVGGYAAWCASAKATDLAQVWGSVQTAPRGTWIAAGGPIRAWRGGGAFLFDASSGRSIRLRGGDAVFSQDGTRAVWGEPRFGFFERKDNRADLLIADLASGRSVATGLETEAWSFLAFSPSGRRLAFRDGKTLSVFDVSEARNPRQLAAFGDLDDHRGFAFVDEDTLRLFPRFHNVTKRSDHSPASFEIAELSVPSKKSLVMGRFDRETLPYLRLSPDARFLVGTRRLTDDPGGAQTLTLHDGRTGALVATLADGLRSLQARFLTGGRIAVAGIAGAQARLVFFEGAKGWGAPGRIAELGPAKRVVLGGEFAPGHVAVSLIPFEENSWALQRGAKLAIVDAATGAVAPGPDGLVPADRLGWWLTPALTSAEAGSLASSLFLDADGRLVRLDPKTAAQTVLLGRSK